jgi:predicted naringenin-chalcone synthase
MSAILYDFRSLPPKNRGSQKQGLEWLAHAHAKAEGILRSELSETERSALEARIRKIVFRFGSATDRIEFRNSALDDFSHQDWGAMRIFDLDRHPTGKSATARSEFFSEVVNQAFTRLYLEESVPPSALIHVTCTGYVSPSGAQRLVAQRGWGRDTEVLHAYHMGCYGSLPAVKIARGLLAQGKPRVDLVHTELCTLHLNPTQHHPEELIVQTLFSDGMIRYSAANTLPSDQKHGLELIGQREEIIPNTEGEMSWMGSENGMRMTLSRKIPEHIETEIEGFLARLCEPARLTSTELKTNSLFAIHPGGPRIIDQLQAFLGLSAGQVAASNHILRNYGNMSSATLPTIWKSISEDESIPHGSLITALAFGPGLTLSGALLRMVRQ